MTNPRSRRLGEWLGWAALAGVTLFFLATSWRKWPDPLVDFGRELYVPWRLSHGALLYRDVADIYGPLSQYANAGLFRLFGPGIMVLVTANLAVFAAILISLHVIFRRAWGAAAALAAAAVFVSVFGFSQFLTIGNYNYATPYSHEATHGLLVCLLLVIVLGRWLEEATVRRSALAGLLLGLTIVLKPEVMLGAAAVTAAAVALRLRARQRVGPGAIAAWAAGAALPTAGFAAYFATQVSWGAALGMAGRGWLDIAGGAGFSHLPLQGVFLGTDRPWANLLAQAEATGLALLLIGGLGAVARRADRTPRPGLRWLLGGALAAALLWLACTQIVWLNIGRCLLGLTLVYIACTANRFRRGTGFQPVDAHEHGLEAHATSATSRLLIAVLAAALMARMFLNGRIYHYGFFEAALAGAMVPAILIGELPARLRVGPWGRGLVVASSLLLVGTGVVKIATQSQAMLRAKTYAIEHGSDRFYTFPPQALGTGDIVRVMSDWLRPMPAGQTAVVLPEGEMINYLARMPSSVAPYAFFAAATSGGREARIVADLQRHPPDWIVIVSRDIRDNGIKHYGESTGEGRDILHWVAANYAPAMAVGGNPLDPNQCGGVVLKREAK